MTPKIYETEHGMWVKVYHGGIGAEYTYLAQTNDDDIYFLIQAELDWKDSIVEAQWDLNDFVKRHGLIEVPVVAGSSYDDYWRKRAELCQ